MFFKSKYSKSSYLHNEYYSSFTAEKFRNSCVDDYSVTLGGTNKHVVINELDNTNYSQRNMNLSQISLNMLSAYWLCESDWHDNLALRSLNQVATGKHEQLLRLYKFELNFSFSQRCIKYLTIFRSKLNADHNSCS